MRLRITTTDPARLFALSPWGLHAVTVSRDYRRKITAALKEVGFVARLRPGTIQWWDHPDGRKACFSHRASGHKALFFLAR